MGEDKLSKRRWNQTETWFERWGRNSNLKSHQIFKSLGLLQFKRFDTVFRVNWGREAEQTFVLI